MALTQRLDLRQSQSLVMTPQLQQAIKLLQLSNFELGTFLEAEVERNPLLDFEEGEPGCGASHRRGNVGTSRDGRRWMGKSPTAGRGKAIPIRPMRRAPISGGSWGHGGSGGFGHEAPSLEQMLSGEINLREHLLGQLNVDLHDPVDRIIGRHLINLLDETGYVTGTIESAAELLGCGCSHIENMLRKLQGFDPPGVFARDLKECLAIQLRDLDRLYPAMEAMLEHLDLSGAPRG